MSWQVILYLNFGFFHYHLSLCLVGFIMNIYIQGTTSEADYTNFHDPGIHSDLPIFNIQPRCKSITNLSFSFRQPPIEFPKGIKFTKLCLITCFHHKDSSKFLKGKYLFWVKSLPTSYSYNNF